MTCPIEQSLNAHLDSQDNADEREEAIAELSTNLEHAAFAAMREELSISPYAGKTTAADMSGAIDTEMFDNLAESLMKIVERG